MSEHRADILQLAEEFSSCPTGVVNMIKVHLFHIGAAKVYEVAADENCLLVFANHDPAVKEQVIEL